MGHVLCSAHHCPPTPCENPTADPRDRCCLKCPEEVSTTLNSTSTADCVSGHSSYRIGDEWKLDDCTSCRCQPRSHVECFKDGCHHRQMECPVESEDRRLMIKGQCCPICSKQLLIQQD